MAGGGLMTLTLAQAQIGITIQGGEESIIRRHHAVLFVLVLFPLLFLGLATEQAYAAKKDESLRRGEKRATLDPNQFTDPETRQAYQIAREIPWVLDSIYCYCYCEESAGHKSLLSCYVDTHAAM